MPLPVNVPCQHCKVDTLHVWDTEQHAWKCNRCGHVKTMITKHPLDDFMRRTYTLKRRRRRSNPDGGPLRPDDEPTPSAHELLNLLPR